MTYLVLKHHEAEGLGSIAQWLIKNNLNWEEVEYAQALPQNVESYSGIIILGGPMHISPSNQRLAQELQVIAHFIEQSKPTLGICLGAQLIATSLGAEVSQMPEGENGWMPITLHTGQQLDVPQWHEQQASLPNGAELAASSLRCEVQMFRYHQHVLACQFHPEWNNQAIARLQSAFGAQCPLTQTDSKAEQTLQKWWFNQLDSWFQGAAL
ncbi:type 1 glutamine amidotransferase [Pseudoalteromonas sp. MM17-2]|uniref:type 1 glutamine amidotransferase n=1 Tax=Pseudoalteromonas sp. MM17-2 TaxID=2917753 RepID=UPI001EF44808|nr:type 1 glutamine amidotransferase [Pseudoalteromonas sp. MM17-2]MCG7546289.1 type 1 glutamine amidotransferase [Pseudoalteromonas sp. MM17-2]